MQMYCIREISYGENLHFSLEKEESINMSITLFKIGVYETSNFPFQDVEK